MRTEQEIRNDIQMSDWWFEGFVNCPDYELYKPVQEERRKQLFNELQNLQFARYDGDTYEGQGSPSKD